MKKHINIPIFIPHLGCPNNCVFCNQRKISGTLCFDKTNVRREIDSAIKTIDLENSEVQIAFFGGSFTGIDRNDMIYLLSLAKEYIDMGIISSIRLSTRPDYINDEILDILSFYGVKTIELGIQSMSDKVLSASGRGHSSEISENSCRLIKNYGFELIGQMMTALPGSSPEDEINTAKKLVDLNVDGSRIYPTMVFAETELESMTKKGLYTPPMLDKLIERTEGAFAVFAEAGIPVIRIGLQSSDGLGEADGITYGAYESAMGEMVISRYYYKKLQSLLNAEGKDKLYGKNLTIYCAPKQTSKIIGQHKENKLKIQNEYNIKTQKVLEKNDIMLYNILISYK